MGAQLSLAVGKIKFADRNALRSKRNGIRSIDLISGLARRFWPERTAPELASCGGISVRQAENLIANRCALSYETTVNLLHNEQVGFAVLEAIMESRGKSPPRWWRALKRTRRLANLRASLEAQRAEIAALELQAAEPANRRT